MDTRSKRGENNILAARALTAIPSIELRAIMQQTSLVSKFKDIALQSDTSRSHRNWEITLEYYAGNTPGRNPRLLAVSASERQNYKLESFSKANENLRRKIPIGIRMPQILTTQGISEAARHQAVLWYLNNLPIQSEHIRNLVRRLKAPLEKQGRNRRCAHSTRDDCARTIES